MAEENVNTTDQIRDRISGAGRSVAEKIDETRDAAATAMQGASESIRRSAENLSGMARSAADRIESAAGYMAEHDTRELLTQARRWVRRHPATSIVGAVAAGFFAGRIMRPR